MNFKRHKPRPKEWDDTARDKTVTESEICDAPRASKVEKPFLIEALYYSSTGPEWRKFKDFASRTKRDAELTKLQTRPSANYIPISSRPLEYRATDT